MRAMVGQLSLWAVIDAKGEPLGAAIAQLTFFPRGIALVVSMQDGASREAWFPELVAQLSDWGHGMGADEIAITGDEGAGDLLGPTAERHTTWRRPIALPTVEQPQQQAAEARRVH
jgi:hypothetical protein